MPIQAVNLTAVAAQIEQPFSLITVAMVGDMAVNLYVCQGQLAWHKHMDEDELFFVHEGVITLESEWGNVTLHPEELAVVPKGVAHRSGSVLRAVVMLVRPAVLAERKNGHRRVAAISGDPTLERVRLARLLTQLEGDFATRPVARVEDVTVELMRALGAGPRETTSAYGAAIFTLRGAALIESDDGNVRVEAGELCALPDGLNYRLNALRPSMIVRLARATA